MSVTHLSHRDSRCDSRCDFAVSHTTPTRPDPTRPKKSSWSPFTTSSLSEARDPSDGVVKP